MKKAIIPICIAILLLSITLAGCNTFEGIKKDVGETWDDIKNWAFKEGYKDGYAEGSSAINSGTGYNPTECMELIEDGKDDDYCDGYEYGYDDGYNRREAQIDIS